MAQLIREVVEPIDDIDEVELGPLLDRIGDARVVLLGEASHGTSEFYRMRARITRELVTRKGFNFVAVEADWPDAARVDHWVRRVPVEPPAWKAFTRFPTWMWRNAEVAELVDWMHEHNQGLSLDRAVGFFGLDLYSLFTSIAAVLAYLDEVDSNLGEVARTRYGCLTPWQADPAMYGRAVVSGRFFGCEEQAVAMLRDLLRRRLDYEHVIGERFGPLRFFDAARNAQLVADAERYYRVMYAGSRQSWNLRDQHMFETLQALLHVSRTGLESGGMGAQLAHRQRSGDGNGSARRAQYRAALPRSIRRPGLFDRFRHGSRHRGGRVELGRAAGNQACVALAPRELRGAVPSLRESRLFSCICDIRVARPSATSSLGRAWSAPSVSSTAPRRSSRATTFRPCCRISSTSMSGSMKARRSSPSPRIRPAASPRLTLSVYSRPLLFRRGRCGSLGFECLHQGDQVGVFGDELLELAREEQGVADLAALAVDAHER